MYSQDYLANFASMIDKEQPDDIFQNLFTNDFPIKLNFINLIIFVFIFCSGYILQKLVVFPHITTSEERKDFKKEIIGKDIMLIILQCLFAYIFGNFLNTFSLKKGINFLLFTIIFYGATFSIQKLKSISGISDIKQNILNLIKNKKVSTSTYVGLVIIILLLITVLIYIFYNAYESGILLPYSVFFLIIIALFVFMPTIKNGTFVTSQLVTNICFALLLCCRFDSKLNSIITGILAAIIINEISWQKKKNCDDEIAAEISSSYTSNADVASDYTTNTKVASDYTTNTIVANDYTSNAAMTDAWYNEKCTVRVSDALTDAATGVATRITNAVTSAKTTLKNSITSQICETLPTALENHCTSTVAGL